MYESRKNELNLEQDAMVKNILSDEKQKHLLYGVTGSGKTHIYISLIEKKIQEGKQVLLLIPEILLSTQI